MRILIYSMRILAYFAAHCGWPRPLPRAKNTKTVWQTNVFSKTIGSRLSPQSPTIAPRWLPQACQAHVLIDFKFGQHSLLSDTPLLRGVSQAEYRMLAPRTLPRAKKCQNGLANPCLPKTNQPTPFTTVPTNSPNMAAPSLPGPCFYRFQIWAAFPPV